MPENKPVEVVISEVKVQVPMSGAAMKQRIDDLKKEKELKENTNDNQLKNSCKS